MDLGLKGKRAILAGASKGIGRATAEILAAEGCDIAICARNDDEVAEAVVSLANKGVSSFGGVVDVSDRAGFSEWIKSAAGNLGGCDIFVCFTSGGGGESNEENWQKAVDIDLMATVRGIEAALPFLRQSKSASIVTISSTAALEEFFGPQPYNAIKAAVINYTSALSQSLAPENIRVNTITPGPIFIKDGAWDGIKTAMPDLYEGTVADIPMGRMGSGEEVAKAIAFTASPACGFMTGANLIIDGGFTKRVDF